MHILTTGAELNTVQENFQQELMTVDHSEKVSKLGSG